MANPYIIRISSQKGGVGKTTIAVNLSVLLSLSGHKVLIIDSDTTNPSIGFHLGMHHANVGYKDVVSGRASLKNAIAIHGPSGLRVLGGTIEGHAHHVESAQNISRLYSSLKKTDFDFIIIDSAPKNQMTADPIKYCDEALVVTTPEMTAITSAMRLANFYRKEKVKHNLVINMVKGRKHEYSIPEIENAFGDRAAAVLPDEEAVALGVASHIPISILNSKCGFCYNLSPLIRRYSSEFIGPEIAADRVGSGEGVFLKFIRRVIRLINGGA